MTKVLSTASGRALLGADSQLQRTQDIPTAGTGQACLPAETQPPSARAELGGRGHDKTSRELDVEVWRILRSKLEEVGGYVGNLNCRRPRASQGQSSHGFTSSKGHFLRFVILTIWSTLDRVIFAENLGSTQLPFLTHDSQAQQILRQLRSRG